MPVADKKQLLEKVKRMLADELTASNLDTAITALSEALSEYDVQHINTDSKVSDSMVEAFMVAKEIEGRSKKTLDHYRYCLTKMLSATGVPVESVNVYHIRQFLIDEKNRGIGDSTLEGYRWVFSCFYGWLYKEGLIRSNPCANIGPIKCEKKIRTPFSDIDLEKLKEACGSDRNRAIFFFLLSTGCRISEACSLNRNDVNLQTLECTVLGKGNKQRIVYLSNVAGMMVRRYLKSRTDNSAALFSGKGSARLTPAGVRFMLKKVAARAGVENVHPHRFRRTLATNLIDHGMSIQEVACILGHEKLDTTMRYVYTDQQNVRNAYKKYA